MKLIDMLEIKLGNAFSFDVVCSWDQVGLLCKSIDNNKEGVILLIAVS